MHRRIESCHGKPETPFRLLTQKVGGRVTHAGQAKSATAPRDGLNCGFPWLYAQIFGEGLIALRRTRSSVRVEGELRGSQICRSFRTAPSITRRSLPATTSAAPSGNLWRAHPLQ